MLLKHHLQVQDPDEDLVAFDDLQAAAKASTPAGKLAQLKAANGSLRLPYGLMTKSCGGMPRCYTLPDGLAGHGTVSKSKK
jgi:hypothetical protein